MGLVFLLIVSGAITAFIAESKGHNPAVAFFVGLVTGIIGIIIYATMKHARIICPNCGEPNIHTRKLCRDCNTSLTVHAVNA